MRLIDADALSVDRMTKDGTWCVSQSQIKHAPTVERWNSSILDDILDIIGACLIAILCMSLPILATCAVIFKWSVAGLCVVLTIAECASIMYALICYKGKVMK